MSFVDVFSGSVVAPVDISYNLVTVTASPTNLQWPSLAQAGDSIIARITELNTSLILPIVTLPDARNVSTGQDVLFRNISGQSIQIQTNIGGALLTLAPGDIKYLYLTNNTTQGGSWVIVAFGVGTSTVNASQLAGLGLIAIATTLNTAHPVTSTTNSFTIMPSDRAKIYNFNGGAATVTLQASSTYGNNFFFGITNNGSGAVTVNPAGIETIDGTSSISINPGESCFLITDGSTQWVSLGRGRSVSFNFTQLVKDVSGNTDVTLTTSEASNKVLKFIGTLTGNINVIVPNVVSQYTVDNETSGAFSLTVKTAAGSGVSVAQANRNILYSDGTNVLAAVTVSVAITSFADGSAASPSITFTANPNTGLFRAGSDQLGISTGGVARITVTDTDVISDSIDKHAIAFSMIMG